MNSRPFYRGLLAALSVAAVTPQALSSTLSTEQEAQLSRDKIVVTEREFRQTFSPYLLPSMPVFITSDVVLNAYHVLLEESMVRVMSQQQDRLKGLLEDAWKDLPPAIEHAEGDDAVRAAAGLRATRVLAVALRLLDLPTPGLPETEEAVVTAEVRKVIAAVGHGTPDWLGRDDPELRIDYTHFQPRGFYTRSPRSQQAWRAFSWLQAVPFRMKNREELMAIHLLGQAFGSLRWDAALGQFLRTHDAFLGLPDNPDIGLAARLSWQDLTERSDPSARFDWPKSALNDQPGMNAESVSPQFRILGAGVWPESAMFQATTRGQPESDARPRPQALEVPMLFGSAFAERQLAREPKWVIEAIQQKRKDLPLFFQSRYWGVRDLYATYVECLQCLLQPPADKRVPSFMKGEAWQRKSCATALGSWAQMRRAFALHSKWNGFVGCMNDYDAEPGFVEPNLPFWQRLTDLVLRTTEVLEDAGAFRGESDEDVWRDLDVTRAWLHAPLPDREGSMQRFHVERAQKRFEQSGIDIPSVVDDAELKRALALPDPTERDAAIVSIERQVISQRLDATTAALARATPDERHRLLDGLKLPEDQPLAGHWFELQRIVLTLERIGQKQLSETAFSKEERHFILHLGEALGPCHIYNGNTYEAPRDDAMKVIDVFSCFDVTPGGDVTSDHWHVGIGRPRAIYVLYPWKGQEVRCIGAVLPFLESMETSPLDDAAWKAKLDGPKEQRPKLPDWYAPLVVEKEPADK